MFEHDFMSTLQNSHRFLNEFQSFSVDSRVRTSKIITFDQYSFDMILTWVFSRVLIPSHLAMWCTCRLFSPLFKVLTPGA